jgi:hypothetical protein
MTKRILGQQSDRCTFIAFCWHKDATGWGNLCDLAQNVSTMTFTPDGRLVYSFPGAFPAVEVWPALSELTE